MADEALRSLNERLLVVVADEAGAVAASPHQLAEAAAAAHETIRSLLELDAPPGQLGSPFELGDVESLPQQQQAGEAATAAATSSSSSCTAAADVAGYSASASASASSSSSAATAAVAVGSPSSGSSGAWDAFYEANERGFRALRLRPERLASELAALEESRAALLEAAELPSGWELVHAHRDNAIYLVKRRATRASAASDAASASDAPAASTSALLPATDRFGKRLEGRHVSARMSEARLRYLAACAGVEEAARREMQALCDTLSESLPLLAAAAHWAPLHSGHLVHQFSTGY